MMTTWRDYLLNKCYTHTWMIYIPGLPRDLDYPEILGLAVPKPVLVLNCNQDALFTVPEMQRADRMLTEVYRKARAPDRYRASFYRAGTSSTWPCRPRPSSGSTAGCGRAESLTQSLADERYCGCASR